MIENKKKCGVENYMRANWSHGLVVNLPILVKLKLKKVPLMFSLEVLRNVFGMFRCLWH